jgi:pyruvate/2-oxoglutarate dehydrogenase complex dihydrolipoamide dehydrogenase (E3) component
MSALAQLDAQWRQQVFPASYRNPAPQERYHLAVIGAGPAGLIIAIAAAGLGARVALIERHAMGGDCLNVGCVPSKTLLAAASAGVDFTTAMQRVHAVRASIAAHDSVARYSKAGVDVFLGKAAFVAGGDVQIEGSAGSARLRGKHTVIATGARAALPPVPGLADIGVLTNETIFDLPALPARLAVMGGGPIGCELAQAFARLGSRVAVVEMQERLLANEEPEASRLLEAAMVRDGVQLELGRSVRSAQAAGATKKLTLDDGRIVEADAVLVAAGRRRNIEDLNLDAVGVKADAAKGILVDSRLRSSNPRIYAAGDVCSKLQFTQNADAQARIIVRNTLFLGRGSVDALVVPWCTYTKPEIARVGASRAQLTEAGTAFDALRVEFDDLDRGRTDDAADGFVEVLVMPKSGKLLGASIVGRDAGEQIAPLLVLMNAGLGLSALASIVLPYPTRAEYLRRLADAWNRKRLTPFNASVLKRWLAFTR